MHPFISAQDEDTLHGPASGFSQPYLQTRRYTDRVERDGLAMTFSSVHRPLSAYAAALTGQGLAITALTEHGGGMIPWLLAMRAEKIAR